MKELIDILGLACAASLIGACASDPANTFTLAGEHIVLQPEAPPVFGQMQSAGAAGAAPRQEVEVDLSTALIVVTHKATNGNGEVEVATLASGNLVDGNVVLVGEIDSPAEVEISVDVAGRAPLPLRTVLGLETTSGSRSWINRERIFSISW